MDAAIYIYIYIQRERERLTKSLYDLLHLQVPGLQHKATNINLGLELGLRQLGDTLSRIIVVAGSYHHAWLSF